jgi:hypothetical protein
LLALALDSGRCSMPDLDIELRRLAAAMVKESPEAPSFDAVTATPVRPTGHPHVPRRTAAFAVGAIALVVIAIVIAVLASPDESEQQPAGPSRFVPCTQQDPGAFIGPNGKRFGPIVDNHPDGGTITDADIAAMPDYIPVTCQTGDTIGGWITKTDMLNSPTPISPELAADTPPDVDPVYADDGTTVVGHMVDGRGFVPLGTDPTEVTPPPFDVKAFFDQPRLPVSDEHGKVRGTIPTSAYMPERLTGVPPPLKQDNTPVAVITDDGKLGGYWISGYGFVERGIVEVPDFDPDAFVARKNAEWEAEHPEEVQRERDRIEQLEGTPTTSPATP